jgi:hypothetical protein
MSIIALSNFAKQLLVAVSQLVKILPAAAETVTVSPSGPDQLTEQCTLHNSSFATDVLFSVL